MVSLFGWFRQPKEEDYATVLATLQKNIDERRQRLAEIRQREQRAKAVVTLYTLVGWAVYVTLWYVGALPAYITGGSRSLEAFGVLAGPFTLLALRRVMGVWYTRRGDGEEKTLQTLMKEQRVKVDEIKKKTNWYETRDLMQRYDASPSTPKQQQGPRQPMPGGVGSPTPVGQSPLVTPAQSPQQQLPSVPQEPQVPPPPSTPARKTWLDKLADAVVGDVDDQARYALICEECFAHNGLVKEQEWDRIQYVCPKCNHFNKAKIPASPSPSSPVALPPQLRTSLGTTALATPPAQPSRMAGSPLRHRVQSLDASEQMEVDE